MHIRPVVILRTIAETMVGVSLRGHVRLAVVQKDDSVVMIYGAGEGGSAICSVLKNPCSRSTKGSCALHQVEQQQQQRGRRRTYG